MEYRFLGRSGLQVSELCLGTMTFGKETDEETCHQMLDRYVDAGGTFIDTADTYSFGVAEEILGRWLKGRSRDDLVIGTKVYGEMGAGEPVRGAGRKHIMSAVEASLRRLGTDYLDLYQVHVFDDATPIEETLSTLDALVSKGMVRFIGASNYTGWQLQKSIDLSRHHGWEPYVSLQPLYNLLDRDAENELIPICLNEGLGVITWSPLGGGLLSGKYRREGAPPEGARIGVDPWAANDNENTWRIIDAVLAVAAEVGKTPAQVSLRWLLQRPGVTLPIIGVRTPMQLLDNLGATGWWLTDEHMACLSQASDRPLPYPYGLQRLPQFRRRSPQGPTP